MYIYTLKYTYIYIQYIHTNIFKYTYMYVSFELWMVLIFPSLSRVRPQRFQESCRLKTSLMIWEAAHRSQRDGTTTIASSALMAAVTTIETVTWRGRGGRPCPLLWPLPGKGQAQARVRASGARRLVWRSERSIHGLTQQRRGAVTRWAWHSTFALTSWPPATAAADRLRGDDWAMSEERRWRERKWR